MLLGSLYGLTASVLSVSVLMSKSKVYTALYLGIHRTAIPICSMLCLIGAVLDGFRCPCAIPITYTMPQHTGYFRLF